MITAILVDRNPRERCRFNSTIVVIKVSVVLFVIALGSRYINTANWGTRLGRRSRLWLLGIGARAQRTFSSPISDSMPSRPPLRKPRNPQRDLPIGIIVSLVLCTILYIW